MLPALLIGYNRPEHTARVLGSLRDAGIRQVYVSLDGPRPGDEDLCARTRGVVESTEWAEKLVVRVAEENQGPGWGPRNAIDWFFAQVSAGIICEDDTVLAPDAGVFLNAAVQDFRAAVPMAAATSLGARAYHGHASYFASRYATTWGWATTVEAWSAHDYAMPDWPQRRATDWLMQVGGSQDFAKYWTNIFDLTFADRGHYWDYQWQYAMWKQGWRCWHPRVNLVTNIGFDSAATHTQAARPGLTALPTGELTEPFVRPECDRPDERVDRWIDRNVYRTRRSLKGRIYRAVFRSGE